MIVASSKCLGSMTPAFGQPAIDGLLNNNIDGQLDAARAGAEYDGGCGRQGAIRINRANRAHGGDFVIAPSILQV